MKPHWTLDSIHWERFDRAKVNPELLRAVKAASLVEGNASDYVTYLREVFKGDDETIARIEQWGREEIQHGDALGRWAELADPSFSFAKAMEAFRAGYKVPPPKDGGSVRGSRSGEMISRCVVESGTSSYYSAMRDATDEPVLKEIAANIAADEFRHYKLFYETLLKQKQERVPFWKRLLVAASRVSEAEDDELAYAFYCGNTPAAEIGKAPYDRKQSAHAYTDRVARMYRKHHIKKAAQMIALAVGASPQGWLAKLGSWLVWTRLKMQTRAKAA
ncbi:MAG: ferritin-like domain-containing protein [Alphaproteobacteria bacterium]